MRIDPTMPFTSLRAARRVELVLRAPDGSPWTLTVSAGIERFIGHYPRIEGIDPGGPLLSFRTSDPD